MKEISAERKMFLEKKLAYAEGLYKGIFLTMPESVKIDPYECGMMNFSLDEKSLKEVMQRLQWQIEFYDSMINKKNIDKELNNYGNLINALKVVRGELYNVILHLREDEGSTENMASL